MKRIFLPLLLLLSLPAFAGLEEGKTAYARRDFHRAMAELSPLADAGDAEAAFIVGNLYADGQDVPQDHAKAIAYYKKASEKGNAHAMVSLGAMYKAGLGVDKDEKVAAEWINRAADLGNPDAAMLRGMRLTEEKNYPDAYKWFRIAANRSQPGEFQSGALGLAKAVEDEKLSETETARLRQEAADFKPTSSP